MKILGLDLGYDEPFWCCGTWEFGIFDQGWVLSRLQVIVLEGRWPNYATFHRKSARR